MDFGEMWKGYAEPELRSLAITVKTSIDPIEVKQALTLLVNAAGDIATMLSHKYKVKGQLPEDSRQQCLAAIVEICAKYNPEYPFGQFLYNCMRNEISKKRTQQKRLKYTYGFAGNADISEQDVSGNDLSIKRIEDAEIITQYESALLPRLSRAEKHVYKAWKIAILNPKKDRLLYSLIKSELNRSKAKLESGKPFDRRAIDNTLERIKLKIRTFLQGEHE